MKKEYISPILEIEIVKYEDICLISQLFGNELDTNEAQGEWIW